MTDEQAGPDSSFAFDRQPSSHPLSPEPGDVVYGLDRPYRHPVETREGDACGRPMGWTFEGERKREIRSMTEQKPKKPGGPDGHSRRDFLRGSGVAAATAVLTGQATLALDEAQAAQAEPKVLSGTVEITLEGQWAGSLVLGRAAQHAARHAPPPAGRDRPQAGLRPRQLRCLHGDRRRRPDLFLHDARRLVPGKDDRDAGELRHRRAAACPTRSTRMTA